jgi:hypothetical protein
MNTFILKLENTFVEIRFISDDISVPGHTYYTGNAFQKEEFYSQPDPLNALFSFSFMRDSGNWYTARSFKVVSASEEFNSLVKGYFKDKIMYEIKCHEDRYHCGVT